MSVSLTSEENVLINLGELIKDTKWEGKVFLAGGAVRDNIMGKTIKDLDFVVNEKNGGIVFSIWLSKKLGNFKEESNPVIYERFGTSKLSLRGNNLDLPNIDLEFVEPRREKYSDNSRKPVVTQGELLDDVLRRDFTINSLLMNVSTYEVLDLTEKGVEDIENGIIRTTSNSETIFKDDALRIMRGVRFFVKYGFKFDTNTLKSMKQCSEHIKYISKERITDELNKILISDKPDTGIRLLKIIGVLPYIIPELNESIGMKQNVYHNEDVFRHSLTVLKNTPPDLKTRLIALFHDIGKVRTKTISPDGNVHFYGHEMESEKMVREIMTRLKYPNDLIDSVAIGVKYHMTLKHGGDDGSKISNKSLRKFRKNVGSEIEHVLDVIHSDNVAHSEHGSMPNQIPLLRKRLEELKEEVTVENVKLPLDGKDLIKLGFRPSPTFKVILDEIQDAWFENPNITYDDALVIVNKYEK